MTTENGATTNGTAEKGPSILAQAHDVWVKAGAKKPDSKELAAVKKAIADADKAFQAATDALEAARKKRHEAALKAVHALGGKARLDLGNGLIVAPTCRGETIFYRSIGETETL